MEELAPITQSEIIDAWFEEEHLPYHYTAHYDTSVIYVVPHNRYDLIVCYCHGYIDRSLAVVDDNIAEAVVFPKKPDVPFSDRSDFIVCQAVDPEFFEKLHKALDKTHLHRYGTSPKRLS